MCFILLIYIWRVGMLLGIVVLGGNVRYAGGVYVWVLQIESKVSSLFVLRV